MKYNIVSEAGKAATVTMFVNDETYVATREHPQFEDIIAALVVEESEDVDKLVGMFDVSKPIADRFQRLSERVTLAHGAIFFDGDRVDDALAGVILDYYNDDNADWMPLVAFMEKVYTNLQVHSRDHLFRWMRDKRLTISNEGDILAYKGVRNRNDKLAYESVHSNGTAIVDGVTYVGQPIPNPVGSLVEMPRSEVTFDPAVGCSVGLHVGNWRYARSFSQGAILLVRVNPRDVVSVPVDSNDEKMRVCRYKVIREVQAELTKTLVTTKKVKKATISADDVKEGTIDASDEDVTWDDEEPEPTEVNLRGIEDPDVLEDWLEDKYTADLREVDYNDLRHIKSVLNLNPADRSKEAHVKVLAQKASAVRRDRK